jgi:hypothetical protein
MTLATRWGDDPELLWNHVRAFLQGNAPRPRPRDVNARSAERREQAQAQALESVRGMFTPVRRTVLRRLFRANEIYAGIRDNHRFYYDHVWWLVRRVYLEKGRRLAAAGRLDASEDVFFLAHGS